MYIYRDFNRCVNGNWTKWKRYNIKEIAELQKKYSHQPCFATIQRWKSSIEIRDGEEEHILPLYMDFDSEELKLSLAETKKVIDFFITTFEIPEHLIKVVFSGGKGFHIYIHPNVFGMQGNKYNTKIISLWVSDIAYSLGLKTVDFTMYAKRKVDRLANTKHHSGLYCVELYLSELDSIENIKKIAKNKREPLYCPEEYKDIAVISDLKDIYDSYKKKFEEYVDLEKLKPQKQINIIQGQYPECVKFLMEKGLQMENTRNKATMVLATYFKDAGYNQMEAEDVLFDWIVKQTRFVNPKYSDSERIALTKTVINTVFNSTGYRFACAFIKSCGNISCSGTDCPHTKEEDQKPAEDINLQLEEASDPIWLDKPLNIPVSIVGKDKAPFIVPETITITCTPEAKEKKCLQCGIGKLKMKHNKSISSPFKVKIRRNSQTVISFINATKSKVYKELSKNFGINEKCVNKRIEITDHMNIERVILSPSIDESSIKNRIGVNYVQREAFAITEKVEINKDYNILAYTKPHPQTQQVCFIVDSLTEKKANYQTFEFCPERHKRLKIFNPKPKQSIAEKIQHIHRDLEYNIVKIYGRYDLMTGLDLVFHSPLMLKFQDKYFKGACELMVLGDTGCAKTTTTQALLEHYQNGIMINGETVSRTGLVYNYQQFGNHWMLVWGVLPRNNGKLVIVDEFTGMDREEIERMSRLRSEGIAEATGIITGKTNALVRTIFLSNTSSGLFLKQFNSGAEALVKLFNKREDIRRLDLCVTVAVSDVDSDVINSIHDEDVEHIYTTDLCKELLLWSWSRKPDDIPFTPDILQNIFDTSKRLTKKYESDCPLLTVSDTYKKIMKLSAATAMRMYSTTDGKTVDIKKEHIDFVEEYLDRIYSNPSMRLDIYSKIYQYRNFLSPEEEKEIIKFLKVNFDNWQVVITTLASSTIVKVSTVKTLLGKDSTEILMKFLSEHYLIEQRTNGYVKTEKFMSVIRRLQDEITDIKKEKEIVLKELDELEDIDIF